MFKISTRANIRITLPMHLYKIPSCSIQIIGLLQKSAGTVQHQRIHQHINLKAPYLTSTELLILLFSLRELKKSISFYIWYSTLSHPFSSNRNQHIFSYSNYPLYYEPYIDKIRLVTIELELADNRHHHGNMGLFPSQ